MKNSEFRILIVDDEVEFRKVVKTILDAKKYHVEHVSNAEMALAKIRKNKYHLILTDLVMPEKNGLELLDEIKKLEDYIKTELNVKEINYSQDESEYIKFYAKPNFRVLGKRFGKDFGKYKKQIEELTHDQLSNFEDQGALERAGETFNVEDPEDRWWRFQPED